jgi:hypothetical protein
MLRFNAPGFVKALISTFLLFSLYYIYAASHFYRDPGSLFYDPSRAFEQSYSLHRETEALSFRNEAFFSYSTNRTDSTAIWKAGKSPTICATVVTVARNAHKKSHPLEVCPSCPCNVAVVEEALLIITACHHKRTSWTDKGGARRS